MKSSLVDRGLSRIGLTLTLPDSRKRWELQQHRDQSKITRAIYT